MLKNCDFIKKKGNVMTETVVNPKETATIAFRVDKQTKEAAEELFRAMGMNMGTALNMFLTQSIHEWRLPFQPDAGRMFQRHLEEAYMESEEILRGRKKVKSYNDAYEMLEDL